MYEEDFDSDKLEQEFLQKQEEIKQVFISHKFLLVGIINMLNQKSVPLTDQEKFAFGTLLAQTDQLADEYDIVLPSIEEVITQAKEIAELNKMMEE